MTLQEAIQRLAGAGKNYPVLCEVKAVNESAGTVDVEPLNEAEFFGVRVNAEISATKGVKALPKIGSKVFIVPINPETGIVVLSSELTAWSLKIATSTVEQNESGLLIQKDSDTLRQALDLLVEAVEKIVVIQGTNPDYVKLAQAKVKIQNILR